MTVVAVPIAARAPETGDAWVRRVAGASGILIGIGYIVVIPLYAAAGVPPEGGAAWIAHGAGKTATWSAIIALSVLTDVLFLPLAVGLYASLQAIHRGAVLIGTGLMALFVILDLAVTWPNYAALVSLAEAHAAAADRARQATLAAAAEYASAVLTSTLEAVYSIVTLSAGILVIGMVMRRSAFGGVIAWLGIATGALGIVAVAASLVSTGLGVTVIVVSTLTTIWVLLVGYRLLRPARVEAPSHH